MLDVQIQNDDVAALKQLSDASSYAGRLVTADALRREFDSGAMRRKSFCEALDIGESTLSTWLQSGRIPRVAAVAYALWLVHKKLANELRQRDESAVEPYVIRCRDGYAVVQPADRATPNAIGHMIASGIETPELARKIAVSQSQQYRKVLDRAKETLESYAEQFDEEDDNWVAEVAADLERARDFKVGPVELAELI